jgi:hypothetical protein
LGHYGLFESIIERKYLPEGVIRELIEISHPLYQEGSKAFEEHIQELKNRLLLISL